MKLNVEPYLAQQARWPQQGRHILAQFDDNSVVVYQAYSKSIGYYAARNGFFGGSFSLERMSWIKPNFLWMMYRCGWASKPKQEVVLAVRLKRAAFNEILAQAVHSKYIEEVYGNHAAWKQASEEGDVRLQWDPDHDPNGRKVERRAIQLGMRGSTLARYAREWLLDVEDISDFVREQYQHVFAGDYDRLLTPRETVYPVTNPQVASRLGVALI